MELTFEQIDGYWIAEFEVSADFNLHIERDTEGRLDIYQRTAGGRYEYINDIGYLEKRLVYDYDFSALVYPKFIKIKSKVKPLIATITTDGEINELKYQEKTLEITSNGTTKVTADTGYNGLAQVNVKVNVPTEGGGSSVEADDIIYIAAAYFNGVFNLSKGTAIVGIGDGIEEISITDDFANIVDFISDSLSNEDAFMSIKNEKILTNALDGGNYVCADSGIKVVGMRYTDYDSGETEELEGTLIYQASHGLIGINVNNSFFSMNDIIRLKKIIASNGREYFSEQE